MNGRKNISIALLVALLVAGACDGWLFIHRDVQPDNPVVSMALNIGRKTSLGTSLTIPQKCASLASLYVQAELTAEKTTHVNEHIIAARSKNELGEEYMQSGCSSGMLLVMNAIINDRQQTSGATTP